MSDKKLSDLSKSEIGRLFPIVISSYNDNWPNFFEKEKQLILNTLEHSMFSRLEHFGNTSVRGHSAKDTIDILMEVDFEETKSQRLIDQMKGLGYEFNWQNEGSHTYMMFVKGYSIKS